MTNREQLQNAYRAIVADLGRWGEAFGLYPGAAVSGTGTAPLEGRSPTFVCGDVAVYREDGNSIFVHKKMPSGTGQAVFIFRISAGARPALVAEVLLADAGAGPAANAN